MESDQKQSSESMRSVTDDNEISLLDIFVVLARQKKIILRTVGVFAAVGLFFAIFSSTEYTSSATVIREVGDGTSSTSSSLAALRGLGISVGGASTGLTAETYPAIVMSREVRLAVVRDTFQFANLGEQKTFVEYVNRKANFFSLVKEYTIGLPDKIIGAISSAPDPSSLSLSLRTAFPTEEEEEAIEVLSDLVRTSEDITSGLMTISVVTNDRVLSAQLAQNFVDQLVIRVRSVFTEKARQNLSFIKDRFREAEAELSKADSALAQFEDRNVGVTSARLESDRQRRQREVTFKSQLYSDLQTQLMQAEIEVHRAEPVITLIERPVASLKPSGPRRISTILLALILGGLVGTGLAFVQTAIENYEYSRETQEKLKEIRYSIPRLPRILKRRS